MRIGDTMEFGIRNSEFGIIQRMLPQNTGVRVGIQNSKFRIQNSPKAGFTLIELIVVVAIIGILATIALPAMRNAPIRAREAVIRADLFEMRSCIDQHLADKGKYPESLQSLVDTGYLRYIPIDPFSGTADGAWEEIYANPEELEELAPFEDEYSTGNQVIDIRYADDTRVALDGTLIYEW
jgi:general secretion pathway protein G